MLGCFSYNILQRRTQALSEEWVRRLPEVVRRLEERIFKDATRDVYLNLALEPVEHHLFSVIKNVLNNNRPLSHHITSSASSTMIPTPGVLNNRSANAAISVQLENTATSTIVATQTTANMGNLISTTNGPTDAGNNAPLNTSDGAVSNDYQHQSANFGLGSCTSSVMSSTSIPRQFSQMIPTPAIDNQKAASANSEFSDEVGFNSSERTVALQSFQQKKYFASQSSHILHSLGAQIGAEMRSNVLHKSSPTGFSNGLANGALGLIGNNMQLIRPAASESFLSPNIYASSPKPLQQNIERQHHHSRMPSNISCFKDKQCPSLLQQISPMINDDYTVKTTDEILHRSDSSGLSVMNNMNSVSLHLQSRANSGLLNHHANLQSMQLPLNTRPQLLDHSEKTNYQSSQSTPELLLRSQQHLQQSPQQPNQAYAQFVHNQPQLPQRHQQTMQNQQLTLKNGPLRKSSVTSNVGEHLMAAYANVACSESLSLSAAQQVQSSELQTRHQPNTFAEGHSKSAQFLGYLPSCQDFQVSVSEESQQLLHPHMQSDGVLDNFGWISSGSQAELMQFQWHPQSLQKAQMPDKPSCQLQEELHQRRTGQDKAQRSHLSAREVNYRHDKSMRQQNYLKQMRWLLFLHHARRCPSIKGLCKEANCTKAQELVVHMDICNSEQCKFPRCFQSRKLVRHIRNCQAADCPVCIPVRDRIAANYKAHACALSDTVLMSEIKIYASGIKTDTIPPEDSEDSQPASKRVKIQNISLFPNSQALQVCVPSGNEQCDFQEAQAPECKHTIVKISANSEVIVKMEEPSGPGQEKLLIFGSHINENMSFPSREKDDSVSSPVNSHVKQETMVIDMLLDQVASGVKQNPDNQSTDQVTVSKSGKPKIKGVSLIELFTPEQIKEHIIGLRQWIGQVKFLTFSILFVLLFHILTDNDIF
ncbi:histone acetyltransferase HAC-like [Musa troglodytarum]|uniref:histone acetyltransferase n=1 Tax=Musa troglodytarum TaxID=320322 RepID=A0A9E7KKD0_9LILI|nr:histone acetyltransferase HAC-like [Musa troglodytarum]